MFFSDKSKQAFYVYIVLQSVLANESMGFQATFVHMQAKMDQENLLRMARSIAKEFHHDNDEV